MMDEKLLCIIMFSSQAMVEKSAGNRVASFPFVDK